MTYIATDTSTQLGEPVFLVHAVRGVENFYITTANANVVAGGNTYTPFPMKIGAVTQSNDLAKDVVEITFPRNTTTSDVFINDTSDNPFSITLYRGHLTDGDSEFQIYWKGRVSNVGIEMDEITIECEPIFSSLKRAGLRARYQRMCRHALYQTGCNLSASSFASAATVTAATGVTLTLSSTPTDGYYTGGMIEFGGVKRYVTNQTGSTLTLLREFSAITDRVASSGSASVMLYPGCDHTLSTCASKFSNSINYGGFPYIPSKNPIGGTSIV